MSLTGIWIPLYRLGSAGAAQNTFTTERALHDSTIVPRPVVPANLILPGVERDVTFRYRAMGIVGCTGTPTFTWTLRLGSNGNITTAAIVLGTAALTMQSGVSNQTWIAEGEIVATTIADAGANSTVRGTGVIHCMGIASPFMGIFNASASATAPTVATVDWSIANYFNLNIACSASNVANTIQLLSEAVDYLIG